MTDAPPTRTAMAGVNARTAQSFSFRTAAMATALEAASSTVIGPACDASD